MIRNLYHILLDVDGPTESSKHSDLSWRIMIMRCFQHGIEQDGSEVTVAERRLLVSAFIFLAE